MATASAAPDEQSGLGNDERGQGAPRPCGTEQEESKPSAQRRGIVERATEYPGLLTSEEAQQQAEWSLVQGTVGVQTTANMLCVPYAVAPDIEENPGHLEGTLWLGVGNLTKDVTKKILPTLISHYGEAHSIRILHDRHCVFTLYGKIASPGKAMDGLQGPVPCGAASLIRFPDNNQLEKKKRGIRRSLASVQSTRRGTTGQTARCRESFRGSERATAQADGACEWRRGLLLEDEYWLQLRGQLPPQTHF